MESPEKILKDTMERLEKKGICKNSMFSFSEEKINNLRIKYKYDIINGYFFSCKYNEAYKLKNFRFFKFQKYTMCGFYNESFEVIGFDPGRDTDTEFVKPIETEEEAKQIFYDLLNNA